MGRAKKSRLGKLFGSLWGYLLVALIAYAWASGDVSLPIIIVGSSMSFLYMLFMAPVWCMAPTRSGSSCRNNANGLLMGCKLRNHKWEKMKMLVRRHRWADLMSRF